MKVLVVSDVHANIAALNTILEKEADYDILCCAGDYTDYGIYPAEVIERFRNLKNTHLVYGNHDLHVINTYESKEWKNVEDGKYKWVHYNCEQLNDQGIRWLKQLPETAYFEADGWKYGIAHQYDSGYGTIESRYAVDKYWAEHYGTDNTGNRRLIFGHTHRQCIHILGDGMEWLNPGSASYRRPDDPDKTAHYAICTAFMALGLMLPGMAAGWLQEQMGYENFFWWVMGCCLVTLLVTACLKIDPEFGKKKQGNN